jgi:hypothetical protein
MYAQTEAEAEAEAKAESAACVSYCIFRPYPLQLQRQKHLIF